MQDIHEIEKLQRAYGYYLEHWMYEEIVDCFSTKPDVVLEFPEGTYLGKDAVKRYFAFKKEPDPEFLHHLMQLSPIIDVNPDNQTAKGRWYSFGGVAMPMGKGVKQMFVSGIYENEYTKEDGKWKIKKFKWSPMYISLPAEGWVKAERVAALDPNDKLSVPEPDIPSTGFDSNYPSGYIVPFHYRHPVTGKDTSENARNASIKGSKPN